MLQRMNEGFEKEIEKKQKEMESAVNDLLKEKEKLKDEFKQREKDLMKKINEYTSEISSLKQKV